MVPLLVGFLVEGEGLFAIGFVGHDGPGPTLVQPVPQIGAVISLVAQKLLSRIGATD